MSIVDPEAIRLLIDRKRLLEMGKERNKRRAPCMERRSP